jgi:hypothetical protein
MSSNKIACAFDAVILSHATFPFAVSLSKPSESFQNSKVISLSGRSYFLISYCVGTIMDGPIQLTRCSVSQINLPKVKKLHTSTDIFVSIESKQQDFLLLVIQHVDPLRIVSSNVNAAQQDAEGSHGLKLSRWAHEAKRHQK